MIRDAIALAVCFAIACLALLACGAVAHALRDPMHTGLLHVAMPGAFVLVAFVAGWAIGGDE